MIPDVIQTERLTLRPFRDQDIDDVLEYARDPEWARYLPVPQPYTRKDAEQFVADQLLADRNVDPAWAIALNGAPVGGISLGLDLPNRVAVMGYSIARHLWGLGYVTEAAKTIIDSAFSCYIELNKIKAMADPRNIGSLRVMEKVGMAKEGVLRQNRVERGEIVDESWCGILRAEWEARKETAE